MQYQVSLEAGLVSLYPIDTILISPTTIGARTIRINTLYCGCSKRVAMIPNARYARVYLVRSFVMSTNGSMDTLTYLDHSLDVEEGPNFLNLIHSEVWHALLNFQIMEVDIVDSHPYELSKPIK